MPFEIIKSGTHWDFLSRRRLCLGVSIGLIVLGLLAIPVRGFRLGIDFAGGTEMQLRFEPGVPVEEGAIRDVAGAVGVENPSVVRYGSAGQNEFLLKFRGGADTVLPAVSAAGETAPASDAANADTEGAVSAASEEEGTLPAKEAASSEMAEETPAVAEQGSGALARLALVDNIEAAIDSAIADVSIERVEFVGPKVGAELRRSGVLALTIACVLILIYIAFRFSARFAPGAVLALVHDVLITSGLWVLFGLEFDLRVLAALLAIVGYSLNDTIIVYDRIRENMSLRTTYQLEDVLNQSVNQTLSRTLLTSLTTLLALIALVLFGGDVIRPFALAMILGILVGTYSSIYVAAPVLLFLEGRMGRKRAATA